MERLTNKREADAQREGYERRLANGYQRSIPVERFLRLAAYEDSELEPEEVSELIKDWSDLCTIIGECGGIDRLRELAEADKDGRVVVLPVKPVLTPILSSMLYIIEDGDIYEDALYEAVVGMSESGKVNVVYTTLSDQIIFEQADIGKTVFLTREEAEKTLEAMREEEVTQDE